jgi:hypothetical protein
MHPTCYYIYWLDFCPTCSLLGNCCWITLKQQHKRTHSAHAYAAYQQYIICSKNKRKQIRNQLGPFQLNTWAEAMWAYHFMDLPTYHPSLNVVYKQQEKWSLCIFFLVTAITLRCNLGHMQMFCVYALWILLKICFDCYFLGEVACHFINMAMNMRFDYVTIKFCILCLLIKMLIKSFRILILNMNTLIFKFIIIVVCLIFFN